MGTIDRTAWFLNQMRKGRLVTRYAAHPSMRTWPDRESASRTKLENIVQGVQFVDDLGAALLNNSQAFEIGFLICRCRSYLCDHLTKYRRTLLRSVSQTHSTTGPGLLPSVIL